LRAAHVCGHDLHTAIGVGIAQVLARLRHRISGRVVFMFQPAEETLAGAHAMIADGVLDRTAPQEIYALHCGPLPVGTFAVMSGHGLPGQDRYHIDLSGPNAAEDGKRLRATIDALSTARRPQTTKQFQKLLSDLQRKDGPLARFVVAESALTMDQRHAHVQGSIRAWPDDRYRQIRDEMRRLVASVDRAPIEFPAEPFPAMVCSSQLSEAAAGYLRDAVGTRAVIVWHAAFPLYSEDFALFLRQVPGAMCLLGVANPEAGCNGVPHTPDFAADERAIGFGVRAMAGLLSKRLHALRTQATRATAGEPLDIDRRKRC
jgi:amidohydrolase